MTTIPIPAAWKLAAAARAWGISRQRVGVLVNTGRVPSAYHEPGGEWRIPVGTPRPEPRPSGRPARQRAA